MQIIYKSSLQKHDLLHNKRMIAVLRQVLHYLCDIYYIAWYTYKNYTEPILSKTKQEGIKMRENNSKIMFILTIVVIISVTTSSVYGEGLEPLDNRDMRKVSGQSKNLATLKKIGMADSVMDKLDGKPIMQAFAAANKNNSEGTLRMDLPLNQLMLPETVGNQDINLTVRASSPQAVTNIATNEAVLEMAEISKTFFDIAGGFLNTPMPEPNTNN